MLRIQLVLDIAHRQPLSRFDRDEPVQVEPSVSEIPPWVGAWEIVSLDGASIAETFMVGEWKGRKVSQSKK